MFKNFIKWRDNFLDLCNACDEYQEEHLGWKIILEVMNLIPIFMIILLLGASVVSALFEFLIVLCLSI